MADESDVETTLATLVTAQIYPQGTNAPSALGPLVRIYRGWPNPTALNADLAAGKRGQAGESRGRHGAPLVGRCAAGIRRG